MSEDFYLVQAMVWICLVPALIFAILLGIRLAYNLGYIGSDKSVVQEETIEEVVIESTVEQHESELEVIDPINTATTVSEVSYNIVVDKNVIMPVLVTVMIIVAMIIGYKAMTFRRKAEKERAEETVEILNASMNDLTNMHKDNTLLQQYK